MPHFENAATFAGFPFALSWSKGAEALVVRQAHHERR
jgi:hypothetical protein